MQCICISCTFLVPNAPLQFRGAILNVSYTVYPFSADSISHKYPQSDSGKTWLKQVSAETDRCTTTAGALRLATDRPTWRAVATAARLQ